MQYKRNDMQAFVHTEYVIRACDCKYIGAAAAVCMFDYRVYIEVQLIFDDSYESCDLVSRVQRALQYGT